jgi:peptide/nickel transport system substrate-binding protein
MIEQPAFESYAALRADPNVEIVNWNPLGFQYMLRFNHLHKPFDNPKVKAAALMALNQEAFLKAQVGDAKLYKICASMFTCGTPYASNAGAEAQNLGKGNLKKAQELLKASGYDGTPIVIMKPTDLASITKLPDVAAQLLRLAGFKVDLQSMDWNTLVSRRAKKDPPAQGGWNIFVTTSGGVGSANPVLHTWIGAACDKGLFGWPCDAKIEELRNAFGMAQSEEERKKIANDLQGRAMEQVVYIPFGQWDTPLAYRSDKIDGIVPNTGLAVLWGITKK